MFTPCSRCRFVRRFAAEGREHGPLTVEEILFLRPVFSFFAPFAAKIINPDWENWWLESEPDRPYCPWAQNSVYESVAVEGTGASRSSRRTNSDLENPTTLLTTRERERERELLLIIVYFRGLESARFPRGGRLINVRTDGYDLLLSRSLKECWTQHCRYRPSNRSL